MTTTADYTQKIPDNVICERIAGCGGRWNPGSRTC